MRRDVFSVFQAHTIFLVLRNPLGNGGLIAPKASPGFPWLLCCVWRSNDSTHIYVGPILTELGDLRMLRVIILGCNQLIGEAVSNNGLFLQSIAVCGKLKALRRIMFQRRRWDS